MHIKPVLIAALVLSPGTLSAEEEPQPPVTENATPIEPDQTPVLPAPPPAAAQDPAPPPPLSREHLDPTPEVVAPVVTRNRTSYGRAGVFEGGGSVGFAAGEEFAAGNLTPSIGWFMADNLQLSGLLGAHYIRSDGEGAAMFSLLVEPSYHLPFGRRAFGFLGLGVGGAHVEEVGLGVAVAPRVGANFVVGDSGVLTPALAYQYTSHDSSGAMTVGTSAMTANLGYTVLW